MALLNSNWHCSAKCVCGMHVVWMLTEPPSLSCSFSTREYERVCVCGCERARLLSGLSRVPVSLYVCVGVFLFAFDLVASHLKFVASFGIYVMLRRC